MIWEAWLTLGVVLLVLWALARNMAGSDVVLMTAALTLVSLGLASPKFPRIADVAASFGNEGVLTVAVLYVVAAALTETGGMALLTEPLLGHPKTVPGAQLRLCGTIVPISAFLNNTAVVSMFIPVVDQWCKRTGVSPSKLFIPLSYVTILGGVVTLIGTSTNLVVQAFMLNARRTDPTVPLFSMFTLTPVGLVCAVLGTVVIVITSRWLLPSRSSFRSDLADARQYMVEMQVEPGSGVDGSTIERAGLRRLPGSYLAAIERDGETIVAVGPEQVLRGNDRLVFVGVVDSVVDLQRIRGLMPATDQVMKLSASRLNRLLVEAVVSDTNPLVGKTIRDGRFRSRYDAAVIAVYRNGERLSGRIGDIVLKAGDTLLLQAANAFVERHRNSRDFFLIARIEESRPVRHDKAWIAIAIMLGMILAASFESRTHIGTLHAALIAAGLMGLTKCVSAGQARRSIDVPVLVAIAAALVIGKSIETTGLAAAWAQRLIGASSAFGPSAVLASVYLLTMVLTEFIPNNAAAALAFPIAYAAAHALGVNLMPFAVSVAIAASAGFAIPFGYQTHLMVLGPGGYRFGDFVRMGLALDVLCGIVTVTLAPIVYPF